MEPQQPINQSIPPTPVQPQPSGKNTPMLVGLGVVAFLIAAVGAWWFLQNRNYSNHQAEQTQNTTQQQQATQSQGLVKYVSVATPAMKIIPQKTISRAIYQATIRVLNVGTITDGQFKDKTLALALYEYNNPNPTYKVGTYAYFVSDSTSNLIAWDKNFFHGNSYCHEDCEEAHIKKSLGFTDDLQHNLDFLPKEFSREFFRGEKITANDHKTFFYVESGLAAPDISSISVFPAGQTETGWQIVRVNSNSASKTVLPATLYYIVLPFGKMIKILPEPDFANADGVPQLTWTEGTNLVASYRYGRYVYGWQECYESISADQFPSTLVRTGTTVKGGSVYEVDAQKYPKVYQCLHEKKKRYEYDPTTQKGTYQEVISYADFVPSHPMFFWKHPYGDLMEFVRSDIVPAGEKAKPVIYLYPQKSEKVSVKVSPIGGFLKTDPDYGSGWVVEATPNGIITNLKDGKQYPYLFWEGGKDGIVETPKQGFVVAKGDISSVLENKLSRFGLNKQERDDFLEFWVPKLSRAPYYFITFITRSEIDRVSPMSVYPQPDTVIRVLMDYKPLTQPVFVEPLNIASTERKGFTVVEWGGIIRD